MNDEGLRVKTVTFSREALKTLRKIPRPTAESILAKIEQYAADPASLANNVKALKGEAAGLRRLRVGDWRVVFDEDDRVVAVIRIGPRGGIYG